MNKSPGISLELYLDNFTALQLKDLLTLIETVTPILSDKLVTGQSKKIPIEKLKYSGLTYKQIINSVHILAKIFNEYFPVNKDSNVMTVAKFEAPRIVESKEDYIVISNHPLLIEVAKIIKNREGLNKTTNNKIEILLNKERCVSKKNSDNNAVVLTNIEQKYLLNIIRSRLISGSQLAILNKKSPINHNVSRDIKSLNDKICRELKLKDKVIQSTRRGFRINSEQYIIIKSLY